MEQRSPSDAVKWSPRWAVVLAWVSLLVPGAVLVAGFSQLRMGLSDVYMSELALAVAPVIIAAGVFLLLPTVAYLIWPQKLLFFTAMVINGAAALLALLATLSII